MSITWSMVDPGERESLVWALVSGMEPGTRLMRWVAVCKSALATDVFKRYGDKYIKHLKEV